MDKTLIDKILSEVLAMEAEDAKKAGALGFMARAMVQATLPHSKPEELVFERRNGAFSLAIMGHPRVGLPYGSIPRLLTAWITTEAVRTKDPTIILGHTLSGFMEQLDMVPTGGRWGSITRLRDQMKRLFSSSISCLYEGDENDVGFNIHLVDQYRLWWSPKEPDQAGLWQSTINLNPRFFDEVTTHPIPIDLRALKALKRSPLALDIYCWLTYRMSYLQRQTQIPWEALQAQFGSDYENTRQGRYNFKMAFKKHLRSVMVVYRDANVEVSDSSLLLKPSTPHIKIAPK